MSKRRLRWGYAVALLAMVVPGLFAMIGHSHFWTGLVLEQLSNITFAIGMVGYKRLMETRPMPQHNAPCVVLSWRVPGGSDCMVLAGKCAENAINHVAMGHSGVLGVVASGIGYFVVQEPGATQVDAGTPGHYE